MQFFETYDYRSWEISESLINYQGGFVRRGLLGEILYFFAKNFHINVEWTIKTISMICFVTVGIFFVRSFLKKGYSLYILPLCFFFGSLVLNGCFWTRKDPLMLCVFIAVFLIFNKSSKSSVKFTIINILLVFTLFIHEVFAFFVLPALFILSFNQHKNKGVLRSIALSSLFLLPGIVAFLSTLYFHGNSEIAQTIWSSWVDIYNTNLEEIPNYPPTALGAIGWDTANTFRSHFRANFFTQDMAIWPLLAWSITFPVVYYISTNALFVFRKNENTFTNKDKTALSTALIFQWLCLFPVFLILSCDYGRIIFYWIASSFALFLLTPKDKIENLFPVFGVKFIEKLNSKLTNILQPTKTTIVLLMMFIGISTVRFEFSRVIHSAMIYNILLIFSKFLTLLKSFSLTLFD